MAYLPPPGDEPAPWPATYNYLANLEFNSIITRMIARHLLPTLRNLVESSPAVALLGPRQVGKTTLALEVARDFQSIYLDLESSADLARLSEPLLYLKQHEDKLAILDEVQRVPGLFQELRGLIDTGRRVGRRTGRFLLLGSASIALLRQSGETLAGRIAYLELAPVGAGEVPPDMMDTLWLRGGFPDSLLAKDDQQSARWRHDFIRTYLERDIPALGPRIPAETLRRFWTMLAHGQGGLLNAAALSRSLGVDGKTVAGYLDLLVDLLLVRRLEPWHVNQGKRLVKSPKVYVRDSGIVHSLLDLGDMDALLGHPVAGGSWEGFVIESLLANCPDGTSANFYRTAAGAEIDLVLSLPRGQRWAIEIKRSLTPRPKRGFYSGCEDISATRRLVAYPGGERYPLDSETEVVPVRSLVDDLATLPR